MKEHPILFSAPMVRALLAGTKTQTRRVCKPAEAEALCEIVGPFDDDTGTNWFGDAEGDVKFACPYGQQGDRLWVRETFAKVEGQTHPWIATDYRATYTHGDRMGDHLGIKRRWTPSIHMPREASRILLEIVSVRVERLQEITNDDAKAEGPEYAHPHRHGTEGLEWEPSPSEIIRDPYAARHNTGWNDCWICAYRQIWQDINGPGSWDVNPWVWVVEFKRVMP